DEANQVTGSNATATFKDHDTTNVGRIARLYLARIGHDLGGFYMFHNFGSVKGCDRYQLSYLYELDAIREAQAGNFPSWADVSGTATRLDQAKATLQTHSCSPPAPQPILDGTAGSGGGGGSGVSAQQAHTYTQAGHFTARVTVSDGHASSNATIAVDVATPG